MGEWARTRCLLSETLARVPEIGSYSTENVFGRKCSGFNGMFGAGQNSRSWQACNNGFRTHLALLLVVHAVGSVTLLQLLTNVACGVEL